MWLFIIISWFHTHIYTWPYLGPGLAKLDAKNQGPGPTRPSHRACFLGPSLARTHKSPSGFVPARPDLQKNVKMMGPGPARGQRQARPGRAFSGRASHGQVYTHPTSPHMSPHQRVPSTCMEKSFPLYYATYIQNTFWLHNYHVSYAQIT